jgi:hypothetical protein
MDQNAKENVAPALVAPAPTSAELAKQLVDEVFAVELDESLLQLEEISNKAFPQLPAPQQTELQPLLEALWRFFKGVELLRQGDFTQTADHFQESAKTFDQFGFNDLRDLSVGMGAYATAVVMLRQLNVGQALEYFAKVKSYLEIAGKFSSRFQSMIDHMEPEALVTSGVQPLLTPKSCWTRQR